MSTVSSSTSPSLANALLTLTSQTQPDQSGSAASDPSAGLDLDQLQLSGSSLASLQEQAQEIAAQNQNSVITTSEQALAANLAAVAALGASSTNAQASQSGVDAGNVLSLTGS